MSRTASGTAVLYSSSSFRLLWTHLGLGCGFATRPCMNSYFPAARIPASTTQRLTGFAACSIWCTEIIPFIAASVSSTVTPS